MRRACLVLVMFVAPITWIACSQQPPNPISPADGSLQSQAEPSQTAPLMIAEGTVTNVDTGMQLLSIKAPNGIETTFSYSEATEVLGAGNTVEGLANLSGTILRIHYESFGPGGNMAVQIEVLEGG